MSIEPSEAPVDTDDESDDEDDAPSQESIQLVASQANVSEKEAEKALRAENNEVVNAIMVSCICSSVWPNRTHLSFNKKASYH